ncbi:cyclin-B1-1-like isoform X2 [Phoenix dactylifera]|uniref:Cyclin-B1-1-like isoform X2 n=1 Tax=Phoenix dactylifera TaxID=42345 RepID=A0A8B9AMV8_PHODC|nr:cyclin-B1-1-like isoform X2 [Phoenix dactylifera]
MLFSLFGKSLEGGGEEAMASRRDLVFLQQQRGSLNYFKKIAGLKRLIHWCLPKSFGAQIQDEAQTATATAANEATCGIVDEPKDLVHDIDALSAEDQLAVVDYVEDIYKFYKYAENSSQPHDYMGSQVEITAKKREILAAWLIEEHLKFKLRPETLYLTFYIIDLYLSRETVLRKELQLVGISAMLIACKYEEMIVEAPEVKDFICISDWAYSKEQILTMEKRILDKLEWNLTVPTPYAFLVRF